MYLFRECELRDIVNCFSRRNQENNRKNRGIKPELWILVFVHRMWSVRYVSS
jgi:hypothetical protein